MERGFARIGGQVAADLLDVVAPRDCLSCSAPGRTLCPRCVEMLLASIPVLDHRRVDRPAAIGGWLEGALGAAVRGYKSGAGRGVARPLAQVLAGAVEHLLNEGVPPGATRSCSTVGGLAHHRLVAIPPSLRARWNRGDDVLGRIVDHAVARLRTRDLCVERVRWLEPARVARDQRDLGARSRGLNVVGSLRVRSAAAPVLQQVARRGDPVIIVDDVLTTGATVREAIRALTDACPDVAIIGAAVVAATPPRTSDRTS